MYFKTMVIQKIYVFYCHSHRKVIFVGDIRSSDVSNVADIKCGGKKTNRNKLKPVSQLLNLRYCNINLEKLHFYFLFFFFLYLAFLSNVTPISLRVWLCFTHLMCQKTFSVPYKQELLSECL